MDRRGWAQSHSWLQWPLTNREIDTGYIDVADGDFHWEGLVICRLNNNRLAKSVRLKAVCVDLDVFTGNFDGSHQWLGLVR
jgi:hypothetical protein